MEEAECATANKFEHVPSPETAPVGDEAPLPPEPPKVEAAVNTWAWTSWWSRPDGYTEAVKAKSVGQESVDEARSTPLPGPTPSEEPDAKTRGLECAMPNDQTVHVDKKGPASEAVPSKNAQTKDTLSASAKPAARNTTSGSWFWSWSNAQNVQANSPPQAPHKDFFTPNTYSDQATELSTPEPAAEPSVGIQPAEQAESTAPVAAAAAIEKTQGPTKSPAKASSWAFWYREPAADSKLVEGVAQKHIGEVAVFDTPSQSHPEAAQFNEQEQPKADAEEQAKEEPKSKESIVKKSFGSLRGRSKKKAVAQDLAAKHLETHQRRVHLLHPSKPHQNEHRPALIRVLQPNQHRSK